MNNKFKAMDIDLLLVTVVRTHEQHGEVIGCLLDIREYLERYKLAKEAYEELTTNFEYISIFDLVDEKLIEKFDKAFE